MVPVASVRVPRAPTYSGFQSHSSKFRLQGLHLLWLSFQSHSTISQMLLFLVLLPQFKTGLGCSDFARHYFRNHFCFLLLQVLRCFNSLGCPPTGYVLACGWCASFHIGFPHSDTPGSLSTYDSPRLFAVCCVLLPLYMPRHSPYALFHLIILAIKSRSLMVFFLFFL